MPTTYLITGANRGIGLEFARQLSTRGKDTLILATAREPARATDLARLVHQVIPLDVADPESIAGLREHVKDRPIDVLINNAGVSGDAKSVEKLTSEELHGVFAGTSRHGGVMALGLLAMGLTPWLVLRLQASPRKFRKTP